MRSFLVGIAVLVIGCSSATKSHPLTVGTIQVESSRRMLLFATYSERHRTTSHVSWFVPEDNFGELVCRLNTKPSAMQDRLVYDTIEFVAKENENEPVFQYRDSLLGELVELSFLKTCNQVQFDVGNSMVLPLFGFTSRQTDGSKDILFVMMCVQDEGCSPTYREINCAINNWCKNGFAGIVAKDE